MAKPTFKIGDKVWLVNTGDNRINCGLLDDKINDKLVRITTINDDDDTDYISYDIQSDAKHICNSSFYIDVGRWEEGHELRPYDDPVQQIFDRLKKQMQHEK